MTAPTITSEAVEAAAEALYGRSATAAILDWADVSSGAKHVYRERALEILIPAAKHIAASALREAAGNWLGATASGATSASAFLLDRAATLEES